MIHGPAAPVFTVTDTIFISAKLLKLDAGKLMNGLVELFIL